MKYIPTLLLAVVIAAVCIAMGLPLWGAIIVSGALSAFFYYDRQKLENKTGSSSDVDRVLQRLYKLNTVTGVDIEDLADTVINVRANRTKYTIQSFNIWLTYLENLTSLLEKSVMANNAEENVAETIEVFVDRTPDILEKFDTSNNLLYKLRALKEDIKMNTRKDGK